MMELMLKDSVKKELKQQEAVEKEQEEARKEKERVEKQSSKEEKAKREAGKQAWKKKKEFEEEEPRNRKIKDRRIRKDNQQLVAKKRKNISVRRSLKKKRFLACFGSRSERYCEKFESEVLQYSVNFELEDLIQFH